MCYFLIIKKVLASWCHLLTKDNFYLHLLFGEGPFRPCMFVRKCVCVLCSYLRKWITGDRCVCSLTICQGYLFLASPKIQTCALQKAGSRAQVINESLWFYLAHLGYTLTLQHSRQEIWHTLLPVKGTVHSKMRIVNIYSLSCYSKPVWLSFSLIWFEWKADQEMVRLMYISYAWGCIS